MAALVDKAMTLHGLPRYYDDPQPHLSFAWALGDCKEQLQAAAAGLGPGSSGSVHGGGAPARLGPAASLRTSFASLTARPTRCGTRTNRTR